MSAPKVAECSVCRYGPVVLIPFRWTFYDSGGQPHEREWHTCHVCAGTTLSHDYTMSLNTGNGVTSELRTRFQHAWATNHVLATMAQMVAGLTGGTR